MTITAMAEPKLTEITNKDPRFNMVRGVTVYPRAQFFFDSDKCSATLMSMVMKAYIDGAITIVARVPDEQLMWEALNK